jgi:beta-phosphoglucomutase
MKYIKGIIFDLDGVLVHTDELHYQAWKQIADKTGIPFDREMNHRLRGVSRMESLAIILEKSGRDWTEEEKQAMADEKNKLYRDSAEKSHPVIRRTGHTQILARAKGKRNKAGDRIVQQKRANHSA